MCSRAWESWTGLPKWCVRSSWALCLLQPSQLAWWPRDCPWRTVSELRKEGRSPIPLKDGHILAHERGETFKISTRDLSSAPRLAEASVTSLPQVWLAIYIPCFNLRKKTATEKEHLRGTKAIRPVFCAEGKNRKRQEEMCYATEAATLLISQNVFVNRTPCPLQAH